MLDYKYYSNNDHCYYIWYL